MALVSAGATIFFASGWAKFLRRAHVQTHWLGAWKEFGALLHTREIDWCGSILIERV